MPVTPMAGKGSSAWKGVHDSALLFLLSTGMYKDPFQTEMSSSPQKWGIQLFATETSHLATPGPNLEPSAAGTDAARSPAAHTAWLPQEVLVQGDLGG